jgi:hypothetical protein
VTRNKIVVKTCIIINVSNKFDGAIVVNDCGESYLTDNLDGGYFWYD